MNEEYIEKFKEAKEKILRAQNLTELEEVKRVYLGKQGFLTQILRSIGKMPQEERAKWGRLANEWKEELESLYENKEKELKYLTLQKKLEEEKIDITLPGRRKILGRIHPINQVIEEIVMVFKEMGFQVVYGPELETDYYNFTALNIPMDHPVRESHDSFYIDKEHLLRTQTSPVQIRVMENKKPPLRVVAPGKCYRRDIPDATHSPMFHQIEGLVVDTDVTFAELKGVLTIFAHRLFGKDRKVYFIPSYFPFTEPSAEMYVECGVCKGAGCKACGYSGVLEILGCGMVHPQVFRIVGIDPEKYTGFAFGMGPDRIAMQIYGIDDIRLFYENDVRFLKQF
ncbi:MULTISPECIES: phenylalanine--tRNA ligase subunit alpha [Dictyoglomus]|jgi:phenylalanyl-tRNA synthetase alpha chain|uniref:Phenylalanine--tRNA ligase alpha subunit n=1 Tax=Dictyoglomus turgidum (strain DSM 6724 / Z-1310) TaxID=515635 RepID=SYFA_DICTD|nr:MULTISPECIES: phenylalanine--tRNA ligase subunit alpha [Dictyoglomus]B8E0D9.1 RecName: Full=Phenylalanine--tRNA ligase alpha subunit; AltName: Full=Phenylalanyl-tRNA synthetase alpha subunit; Short=PheRS [Dictyoglomus turgidum DSM 6724]ACK42584.1 phenylalanyl-tRNA synthetase, alpha subunit [Dictyoglomus turgidum DSM 6724]PNV80466.1 MAG: phenylalanine--tRNA ligase subunit alpha [Dictyoglomus turgidum]HBU31189.1 phenylalanine--tRNA ligase subunit alpha [Dictyoglomus sp.]